MPLTLHLSSLQQRGASPWSLRARIKMLLWEWAWILLCVWTPKPFNPWRLLILRIFGAKIHGSPFIHQRARIQIPWNLEIEEGACVGDRAHLYSLDLICLGKECIVAQEAYLCTGTHDFSIETRPLVTAPIVVGANVFIGTRAFIFPGISLGEGALVGACSVVTRSVAAGAKVVGSPASPIS
ncbi:MAG: putative colanic acid biosynthesis acetyltransferase [Verrucomicrobia bacterium]|nr:MAG: putative colanic acid biosynthesis acetyltransferase [Verrucomicrobiota bacterium]